MKTQCPRCESVYTVRPDHLREAMGMVRCPACRAVFNAVASLTEGKAGPAPEIGSQLRVIHAGDRKLIDPKALTETGVFRDLGKLQEAEARARKKFEETQAIRLADYTQIVLPDVAGTAPRSKAVRERDATGAQSLLVLARSGLGAAFSDLGLAFRSLSRQGRRTAIGLASVAFGVIALLLASGFIERMYVDIREATIRSQLGHLQIVREGYHERGRGDPEAYLVPPSPELLARVEALPHVEAVARRVSFTGLASFGETTISFLGEGVEPAKEARLSASVRVIAGADLDADDPRGIIVGAGLAANLGVAPGDQLVLLANTAGGGVNAVEATVRGVFRTFTKAFDDSVLRVPITLAQQLTRFEGAHQWVVLADDTANTEAARQSIAPLVRAAGDLEVVPWYALADFYQKTRELFGKQVNVVRLIIAVIILVSISNALVMSVMERTGEIGTLMALGLRRRKVLKLFVQEGFLLGALGALIGLLVGYPLALAISAVGIPMPPPPGSAQSYLGGIELTTRIAVITGLLAVAAAVLASLYPAWKASRMIIVDALRKSR